MPKPSTTRADARLAWARQALHDPGISLVAASSDASFRSYWRTADHHPNLIVMDAPPGQEDVPAWLRVGARLAQAGVHVPAVYASDVERGFVLIEDLGERLYLAELNVDSAERLYGDALRTLLIMQTRVDTRGLPAYDDAFLRRELELLAPWFLQRHLGDAPDAADQATLDAAFDLLVANATEQPQCFVHRDYHSRNLMVTAHDNPGVIDFQGAMRGPVTYDLASLLRDCYIAWDTTHVDTWMLAYHERAIEAGLITPRIDAARWRRWFDLTGLQRHLKVLGLFCRLAYRDGKPAYLADLPRVLAYVLGVTADYRELGGLARLLEDATHQRDLTRVAPQAGGTTTCAP